MYYFDNKNHQKSLKKEMVEWIGTPYRYMAGVKGIGVDCAHFILCVLDEIGFLNLNSMSLPHYSKDWHNHTIRELARDEFKKVIKADEFNFCQDNMVNKMLNGDIILFNVAKASSHFGIYFDNYVYQSIDGIGVKKIIFTHPLYFKRMKYVMRLLK